MSENRETPGARGADAPATPTTPGAPVEENAATETEILEAVERATSPGGAQAMVAGEAAASENAVAAEGSADAAGEGETEPESTPDSTATTPFAVDGGALGADAAADDAAEQARREEIASVDTQLDMKPVKGADDAPTSALGDLPTAAALPEDRPVRDGEIRISADHPMAALYMQTPLPPDLKGNRGAGVLISLLATVAFAVLLGGMFALRIATEFPPSTFWSEGLEPHLLSYGFFIPVAMFLVAMVLLVLLAGKAGWWAYTLGGLPVGVLVWLAAALGKVLDSRVGDGVSLSLQPDEILSGPALMPTAIIAGVIAREVTVWFGAWIGRRGRKIKQRNAVALAEYDEAVAEARAQQP